MMEDDGNTDPADDGGAKMMASWTLLLARIIVETKHGGNIIVRLQHVLVDRSRYLKVVAESFHQLRASFLL